MPETIVNNENILITLPFDAPCNSVTVAKSSEAPTDGRSWELLLGTFVDQEEDHGRDLVFHQEAGQLLRGRKGCCEGRVLKLLFSFAMFHFE